MRAFSIRVNVSMVTAILIVCGALIFVPGCGDGAKTNSSDEHTTSDEQPKSNLPVGSESPGKVMRNPGTNTQIETSAQFVDVSSLSGVTFTYRNGEETGHFAILESLGGGVVLLDFDLDGHMDLFFPGGGELAVKQEVRGRSPGLFRNEGNWHFTKVTRQAGVEFARYYSHGGSVGDYDNDGFPDVLITGYGGVLLFHNQGDGTFEEVAESSELNDHLWSSSAGWGDLDHDGDLDLYIAHYVNWSFSNHPLCKGPGVEPRDVCPPRDFEPLPDVYYLNNGDGTFRDASEETGLRKDGKGLGVLMADLDLDGNLDVYVANDTVSNFFYRNDGTGHLVEEGLMSGTSLSDRGVPDGSMGVDLGDYNLDGLPDLWVSNYERESFALYRNAGKGFFRHASQATGVTAVGSFFVGWGTVFFDFDRDGDEDVFVSNGHVIRFPQNAPLNQMPLLFENRDSERFENVAPAAGSYMNSPHMGRGVARGDMDIDGDQDLIVSHTNEQVALLSNESKNNNHWIALSLVGIKSNRDAVGSFVRLLSGDGRQQTRQVKSGSSYASSNSNLIYFGLGQNQSKKFILTGHQVINRS